MVQRINAKYTQKATKLWLAEDTHMDLKLSYMA